VPDSQHTLHPPPLGVVALHFPPGHFDSPAKTSTFAKAMDDMLLREFRFTFIAITPAIINAAAIPPKVYLFISFIIIVVIIVVIIIVVIIIVVIIIVTKFIYTKKIIDLS
jgi:ABC-type multidrug transport system fused ATPase/permease subunit